MAGREYETLLKMRGEVFRMMDTFCGDVVYCENPKFQAGLQLCDPQKDDRFCPYRSVYRQLERLLKDQTVRIERARAEEEALKGIYERLAERACEQSPQRLNTISRTSRAHF